MAFTGSVALVATLVGMTITGIGSDSKFAYMPDIVNSAQLPLFYVRTATIRRETSTLNYSQGLKEGDFEAVILVREMALDTQANNIANAATLEDAISTALETNAEALGLDGYEIVPEPDTISDGTPVWALVIKGKVSG